MTPLFNDEIIKVCGVIITIIIVIGLMFKFLQPILMVIISKKKNNPGDNSINRRKYYEEKFATKLELSGLSTAVAVISSKVDDLKGGQTEIRDDIRCIKDKIMRGKIRKSNEN